MQTARGEAQSRQGIIVDSGEATRFVTRDPAVALPNGQVLVAGAHAAIAAGKHALPTGPSGSGKSMLSRAFAGIWPFGRGQIAAPPDARVLFLPQRPYVPIGTFRDVVSFPCQRWDLRRCQHR